ncbi:AAA family ATP:ADP antiporter [Neolewinella xylanilytica]|uniref:ADP,ATP carrier protein n=1 Tax=Neolewinella xylanilytica TaxID=1514080 RepID=A0A2S6I072_9BACT|nr:Npt1/Npt2 family nucleotide transporter [Neolewinella xylanilytica]PPK84262.1 AAA family ATP:ADP antiporter [Neolewinella xylanilytica]
MQQVLSKVFRARPGEWGAVLMLQLLVFLIICTLLIVKPTASAMFLSEYGAIGLPYIFLATAVLAAVVSTGYSAALRRYSLLRVSFVSLVVCLGILLVCSLFMRIPLARPTIAIVLYLWTAIFGVLAASQFWMMASFVFDVRQAKRLFGLIGAGAIAGGIAGGYITSLLAQEIGARNLILVAAALLVPSLLLTAIIWRRYVLRKQSMLSRKKKSSTAYEAPHRLIFASKHLLLLCGVVALSVIVAKLVDYQFSVLAAERYGDQDRLAGFFGFWYSTFNIVALAIQLLLTQRVVQGIGVSGALLFLPVGLGIGAITMLFMPGLSAAIISRSIDGSLKQSLSRASIEMLFLPLDEETKKKVKTYIDVFVDSLAGGLGGLLLIGLTQLLGFSAPSISWVVLILVVVWMLSVILIREEYIEAFRAQLSHLKPKEHRNRLRSHHRKVMAGFLQVLEEGQMSTHEKQLLYVLERADDLSNATFREPITRLLAHPSPNVRARALRSLYLQPGTELVEEVIALLEDADPTVRSAAFDYLFSRTQSVGKEVLEPLLDHSDPEVAGAALVSLATETAGNSFSRKQWQVSQRLRRRIRQLRDLDADSRRQWYVYLLKASGRSQLAAGRSFIQRCLLLEDEEILRYAILAAGESQHEDLIVPLLHLITHPEVRPLAINALVQYQEGLLGLIPGLIASGELSITEVRRLPQVIEKIDRPQSIDLLFSLMERHYPGDLPLRMEVIRALNAVKRDFPKRSMPAKTIYRQIVAEARQYESMQEQLHNQLILLQFGRSEEELVYREAFTSLMKQRMRATFNRLFRLLGLRYPSADIIPVHLALNDDQVSIQISGIEFLDNLLELSLKRLIIPLLDRRQRQLQGGGEGVGTEVDIGLLRRQEFRFFRRLLRDRDERLKIAALRLISTFDDPDYIPVLDYFLASDADSAQVRMVAQEALEELRVGLSTVEV